MHSPRSLACPKLCLAVMWSLLVPLRFQSPWCNCRSAHFTWPLTCSALEAIPALLKGPREISAPPQQVLLSGLSAQGLMRWYLSVYEVPHIRLLGCLLHAAPFIYLCIPKSGRRGYSGNPGNSVRTDVPGHYYHFLQLIDSAAN